MYQIEYPNTGIKIQDSALPCGGRRETAIGRKGTKLPWEMLNMHLGCIIILSRYQGYGNGR